MTFALPKVRQEGREISWIWAELGIELGFSHLSEEHHSWRGELTVARLDVEERRTGFLLWQELNLGAGQTRSAVANQLVAASQNDQIPWRQLLEYACLHTVQLLREGEPVVDLGASEPSQDVRWLLRRFLPDDETTTIFAEGGSGKSILALALGVSVEAGRPLLSCIEPVRAGPVLYLDWETHRGELGRRLWWLARGHGLDAPARVLYLRPHRPLVDEIKRIRTLTRERRIALVILDSLGPACGGEPERAQTMIDTFDALRELSPAARLVLSHVAKNGGDDPSRRRTPFGSVYVRELSRVVWELRGTPVRDGTNLGLFLTKSNYGQLPSPLGVHLTINDADRTMALTTIAVASDPDLAYAAGLSFRIANLLGKTAPLTTNELAEELDAKEGVVRATLNRMTNVVRVSNHQTGGRGNVASWALKSLREDGDAPF